MEHTNNLAKVLITLNNIYIHCAEAKEAHIVEVDVINHWKTEPGLLNTIAEKTLESQELTFKIKVIGPKCKRPPKAG